MAPKFIVNIDRVIDRCIKAYSGDPVQILEAVRAAHLEPEITPEYLQSRLAKKRRHREQLDALLLDPGVQQRTEEWYKARTGMITASEIYQTRAACKSYVDKKVAGILASSKDAGGSGPASGALKWGVMFEPVACSLYEKHFGTKVHTFGLLRHPVVECIGASPDGITEDGVLIEIKCPYSRKSTGDIPPQYMYQMQTQLAVCQLDECDYVECEFADHLDLPSFVQELAAQGSGYWGVFVEGINNAFAYDTFVGHFSKDTSTEESLRAEAEDRIQTMLSTALEPVIVHIWALRCWYVERVYKDDAVVDSIVSSAKAAWALVQRDVESIKATGKPVARTAASSPKLEFLCDDSPPPWSIKKTSQM